MKEIMMSFNPQKMANLIVNECESIEQRCEGYKKKLVNTIVEILTLEKNNIVKGTNIQQKIDDACKEAGDFLAKKREKIKTMKEEIQ